MHYIVEVDNTLRDEDSFFEEVLMFLMQKEMRRCGKNPGEPMVSFFNLHGAGDVPSYRARITDWQGENPFGLVWMGRTSVDFSSKALLVSGTFSSG